MTTERLAEVDRCISEAAKHTRAVVDALAPPKAVATRELAIDLLAAIAQTGEAVRQLRLEMGERT